MTTSNYKQSVSIEIHASKHKLSKIHSKMLSLSAQLGFSFTWIISELLDHQQIITASDVPSGNASGKALGHKVRQRERSLHIDATGHANIVKSKAPAATKMQ